ncbi:unnamed protein product [Ixodes pacificus]
MRADSSSASVATISARGKDDTTLAQCAGTGGGRLPWLNPYRHLPRRFLPLGKPSIGSNEGLKFSTSGVMTVIMPVAFKVVKFPKTLPMSAAGASVRPPFALFPTVSRLAHASCDVLHLKPLKRIPRLLNFHVYFIKRSGC